MSEQQHCTPSTGDNDVVEASATVTRSGTQRYIIAAVTWICRLLTGAVFIYSGFTKAVDPWGTIYKMHDYLAVMPDYLTNVFSPLLTVGVYALFSIEFLIGVFLVLGAYRRIAPIGAALLMVVMLPLTLWIALENPVADCGCFGDALVLSNWETFWKNVVITAMAVWMLRFNHRCRCLVIPTLQWLTFLSSVVFIITIGFIGYSFQPLIDYRPYPAGSGLMDFNEDESDDKYDITAIWKRGNETINIPADSIPEGDDWEFVDRKTTAKASGRETYNNEAKGLAIFDENEEVTEDVLSSEGEQVIIFMTDLPHISTGTFYKFNSLYSYCVAHDIPMIGVVAATPLQIDDFKTLSLAEFPIYTTEDTAIKEVVRGNPAVVYTDNGKIVWKSSLQAIPTDDFMQTTPDSPKALRIYNRDTKTWLDYLLIGFIAFNCLVILLSHVPMVIRASLKRRRHTRYGRFVKDGNVIKLLLATIVITLTSCHDHKDDPANPNDGVDRTVLIYMVANNNLLDDAIADINEMRQGYQSASERHTAFLIYLAHPDRDNPSLFRLQLDKKGKTYLQKLKDYGNSTPSVDPVRIREVIEDTKRYSPTTDYGLFLWSHSTAWIPDRKNSKNAHGKSKTAIPPVMKVFGDDYGKSIGIVELSDAIPRNTFSFIWMDCCLMANIETIYQLRNHCEKYVGYCTEIPAEGAPYDVIVPLLSQKNFSLNDAAMATYEWYLLQPGNRRSCPISITSTEILDNVAATAKTLVPHDRSGFSISTAGLQRYGLKKGIYFYDLIQSFENMAAENNVTGSRVHDFVTAVEKSVVFKRTTETSIGIQIDPEQYSGLSCSLPFFLTEPVLEYYRHLDWWKDVYSK